MEEAQSHIIDADRRLSQSQLWHMQRLAFERLGMRAWQDDVVPHDISSNPVMARAYSRIVMGYLQDCITAVSATSAKINPSQPFYIIELGAGSGRLAAHFLHQFSVLKANSALAQLPVTYVMTDFVPEIIDYWQQHEKLKAWVAAGMLDFALFDVMDKRPLSLIHTKVTLTPEVMPNPLILIANYFFDSIPQDSFVIEEGQLCENLLTLVSTQPEPTLDDPAMWDRLSLAYEPIPLQKPYYDVPVYNQILDAYEAQLPDTTLTFPNEGLDCLRYWQGFGNGRLLLLTGDRGVTLADALVGQSDPLPNLHGSFSMMVNYHALGEYVTRTGGIALHPTTYQDNLQVNAYLLGELPNHAHETRLAVQTELIDTSPDDFFALRKGVEPHLDTLTLPQLLSMLRLYAWDADLFQDCYTTLLARVQTADPVWYADVLEMCQNVWQQYFPLSADDDLAGKVNALLTIMGWDIAQL